MPPDFNYLAFSRLKSADRAYIASQVKTKAGREAILGELARYVRLLAGSDILPDDEFFILGSELKQVWPAGKNDDLLRSLQSSLSDEELQVVAAGLQPGRSAPPREPPRRSQVALGRRGPAVEHSPAYYGLRENDVIGGSRMKAVGEPLQLTAGIVASYVGSTSRVHAGDIPNIIRSVRAALMEGANEVSAKGGAPTRHATPAQIRQSITPDALSSFLDNKPYKTLKRHLARHGLSMADYRQIYGLPPDYPSVAPSYSAARSEMARKLGLGAAPSRATRITRFQGRKKVV